MAIKVADNFRYQGRKPLDDRLVCETIVDMTSIAESIIYDGIMVYNKETEKFYVFKVGNTVDTTLGKWREFESGSSESYVIAYNQDISYKKDMLVYLDNQLARVTKDFVSDNVELTIKESFEKDIDNLNLVLLSGEGSIIILKDYIQDTLYYKNDLINLGDKLTRADHDFTSDNTTGKTLEESFAIDIANGNLILINGGEEFAIYLSNKYLEAKIGDLTIVKFTDLLVTGITIDDLKIDNLIYDNDGTIGKIISIDKVNNEFEVETINVGESNKLMPISPNTRKYIIINPGMGYVVGDIIQTTEIGQLAEVTKVGINGEIEGLQKSEGVVTPTLGTNAVINTEKILHAGNGKDWFEIPEVDLTDYVLMKKYDKGVQYKKNTLVYHKDYVARVVNDYTSDNKSSTTDNCFKQDEVNGNIIVLNKEQRCTKEYKQGTQYYENMLVYLDNQLAIVFIDYVSDNTKPTIKESFEEDIKSKSLILVGGTSSASIEEYIQNKDYKKDTLVYLDNKLARVIIDYKSDNLKPTVEESFKEDILNNKLSLVTSESNGSIEIYKSSKDLNSKFENTIILTFSDLVTSGITINDLNNGSLVYDKESILGKITTIDKVNDEITVTTILTHEKLMPIAPDSKQLQIDNGGSGYANGDIVEVSSDPGMFCEVIAIDDNGIILEVSESNQTSQNTSGINAIINYEQVVYGGYGNNWAPLSKTAIMASQTVADSFEFDDGYEFTITNAGIGYAPGDVITTDIQNLFVEVTQVGINGEIEKVKYVRNNVINTSGSNGDVVALTSSDMFIIPDKYWNKGISIFSLTNDNGAMVQFHRTEESNVKYAIGSDNKIYRFEFDKVNGAIYQTYSEIKGGSGSALITEDITSNLDVGNIKPNDVIKKDTSLTDFVKRLLVKEILPTGKITATKSGLNLKGSTVTSPEITATVLSIGDAKIEKIEFYRGSLLEDTQNYIDGTNVYKFTTSDINSDESISIKIHYIHKDKVTKDVLNYSLNYIFVNYSYFGLTNGIPTNADIIGLSSNLKNTKAFTGTISPVNQHIVYAYPAHLGELSSIKDQNGFDYITNSYTKVTMTVNGEDYKVYYLTDPVTSNGLKQIYA